MKILVDGRNIVIAKAEEITVVDNGFLVMGTIYPPDLTLEETSNPEILVQKHKFVNGEVVINEDYTEHQHFDIKFIMDKFKTAQQILLGTDPNETPLPELKVLKINTLKEKCSEEIYKGFVSESLKSSFGFNETDQNNFTQQLLLIVASAGNYKKNIQWKTLEGKVIDIDAAQFIILVSEAEAHKRLKQTKYWALESEVISAETKEEVLDIKW